MNKVIFKFSSVTYAMRAKEVAENLGARAEVKKNPRPAKNEGCGYRLTVTGNPDRIVTAFDLNRIRYISYEMV